MVEIDNKFYKEENYYNEDVYLGYREDIVKYVDSYKKDDYFQILDKDKRTNIVNTFSNLRANILKWYEFKKDAKILEVGANYGELSYELAGYAKDLTIVEFSREKANCIKKRLYDIKNAKIILCTNLKEVNLEEKYDYITLFGIAEYARKIGFGGGLEELLEWSYNHLTQTGRVLLSIDNKFGARNLAGSTKYKDEIPYALYKSYVNKNYEIFGKDELEEILSKNKNIRYKFFYPVPDYKITHSIYTDEFLPKKVDYNLYYREDEEILFNELTFLYETIKNNKFDFFTNNYLVEITRNENVLSDTLFVNFTNIRKEEYKIITKIKEKNVTKEAYSIKGIEHINQIEKNIEQIKELGFTTCEKKEEERIVSSFIEAPALDEYLLELINQNKIEEFYEELQNWENYLKEKLKAVDLHLLNHTIFEKYNIEIEEEEKNKLTFIKDGFIDLMFQNVFYTGDNSYIVFDQEWYEENIPIEYIMYRSIKQLFFKSSYIEEKINKEDVYKQFEIYPYIKYFEQIEEKWQDEITDKGVMDFYIEKWSRIISIEDIKSRYNQELSKVYEERDNFERQIDFLNNENKVLKDKMQAIENSKSYKLTRFLRRK